MGIKSVNLGAPMDYFVWYTLGFLSLPGTAASES